MQSLYTLNKALMPKLEPQIYSTKKKEIEGTFDVPVDNAIATNKIGNAITLLHFNDKKIKYKTVKKNFLDYVGSGSNGFMPIFSEDIIAYSIGRGFLLFNLNNKKFNYYSIAGNFDYVLSDFYAIDPEKRIFVFKIRDRTEKQPTFLRVMDLSTDSAKILIEKEIGYGGIVARNKIMFSYYENTIRAINSKLEEIEHPLVTIFNKEKHNDFGDIYELVIHPVLPFAILKEKKRDELRRRIINTWTISWRETDLNLDKPLMIKLLSKDSYYYTFSYDGKWLWFIDSSISPRNFTMMPIDPDLPYFVGKPIALGDVPKYPSGEFAMTRNPSGLVVSACDGVKKGCKLLKWDFTDAEKFIEKNK